MTKRNLGACLILAAAGCTFAPRGGDSAEDTAESVSAGGIYVLHTLATPGSCADVSGSGTANGTRMQEWSCNGTGAQSFQVRAAGAGTYNLVNTNSNKCVDVNGAGTANGTKIQIYRCNKGAAQAFELRGGSGGSTVLFNPHSGKCVDVAGAAPNDGTPLQLYDCNGTNAQAWTLAPVGGDVDAGSGDQDSGGGTVDTGSPPPPDKCDASNPQQYISDKTIWCVDPQVWAAHSAEIKPFFAYGDGVIVELEKLFGIVPTDLPYYIVARAPDGGAQTPSRYGPGEEVTGDAYYNDAFGVKGYWGYLLTLHELINQWTGLVSSGWPTDWWADHRSPFPNSMDWHIMADLGYTAAANAQKGRFTNPSSGEYDAEVKMFDDIFDIYGFNGYRSAFDFVRRDGVHWDNLADPPNYNKHSDCVSGNPSQMLAEYVIAYLSLPAGKDLSAQIINAGVGKETTDPCPAYAPSPQAIGDIADAHCAIASAGSVNTSAAKSALRRGDYKNAAITSLPGGCSACAAECGCSHAANRCVARWRAN